MQSLMGGFRLAVGRVSLVHTLCYCQHRARGRRARLDAGGQRMPCKFSSPSHPVLLSAQGPGGAEHVEVQEAGGGAPLSPESAAHPRADLELQNSHHHTIVCPRLPLIHLPESQQMRFLSPESIYVVVRASALDLRLAQRQRAVTKH